MKANKKTHLFPEERRRLIVTYVTERNQATVEELCAELAVSPATIRNDLNQLHDEGLLNRTHGGAIAKSRVNFEPSTADKNRMNLDQKRAIASEAVKHIHEGDCIALDGGTTVFELAKLLGRFRNLHIITYDLSTASWLDSNTDNSLFVIGGEVRKGHHYMMGSAFRDYLPRLNVDTFFMSANGVDLKRGVTTPQVETAMMKEQVRLGSRKVILMADSTKLGNVAFAKFADLQDVDMLITDNTSNAKYAGRMRAAGVEIAAVSP